MSILLDSSAYSHLKRGHRQVTELVRASEEIRIFFPVGGFLGAHHVRQRGDENAYPFRCLDLRRVPFQVGIASRASRMRFVMAMAFL